MFFKKENILTAKAGSGDKAGESKPKPMIEGEMETVFDVVTVLTTGYTLEP